MPRYLSGSRPSLAYREDCAVGTLAILDRSTGEKHLYSSAVSDVRGVWSGGGSWVFFVREPSGGEPELWAVPEGKEPVFVGLRPDPALYKIGFDHEHGHGFFVFLDHDGATSTLGTWAPVGGFKPLLDRTDWPIRHNGYLTAVADREGDAGALVGLHLDTLDPALRVERVAWRTLGLAVQAPLLGYVRGWNDDLGAGTFEVWVQPTGQRVIVDEGVSEYREMVWPRPGVIYAVRTPWREGLWTAYPDL